MKKSDFDFDLPPDLIAQAPLARRSGSRLLVVDVGAHTKKDRKFYELPEMLQPGDLLIFNDTRVLPARLYGRKDTGGEVEILIERVTGPHEARAQQIKAVKHVIRKYLPVEIAVLVLAVAGLAFLVIRRRRRALAR